MSAYSDWRCGALSDEEYRQECNYEARRDEYLTHYKKGECDNCIHLCTTNDEDGREFCECEFCEFEERGEQE